MWNRLVAPYINDRDGTDGGGEGSSDNEDNGGRKWLSAADMTLEVGVAVGLLFCFMAYAVKNKELVGIQGVSDCTLSTRLYGELWEHVA